MKGVRSQRPHPPALRRTDSSLRDAERENALVHQGRTRRKYCFVSSDGLRGGKPLAPLAGILIDQQFDELLVMYDARLRCSAAVERNLTALWTQFSAGLDIFQALLAASRRRSTVSKLGLCGKEFTIASQSRSARAVRAALRRRSRGSPQQFVGGSPASVRGDPAGVSTS